MMLMMCINFVGRVPPAHHSRPMEAKLSPCHIHNKDRPDGDGDGAPLRATRNSTREIGGLIREKLTYRQ